MYEEILFLFLQPFVAPIVIITTALESRSQSLAEILPLLLLLLLFLHLNQFLLLLLLLLHHRTLLQRNRWKHHHLHPRSTKKLQILHHRILFIVLFLCQLKIRISPIHVHLRPNDQQDIHPRTMFHKSIVLFLLLPVI